MAANWRENCAQEAAVRIFQILTHFPVVDNDCLSRMQILKDAAMNADILLWEFALMQSRIFSAINLTDANFLKEQKRDMVYAHSILSLKMI